VFERFTDRARRVVVLAQESARHLNHDYIGAEHLLIGLIHEGEGLAAQALKRHGMTHAGLLAQVAEDSPPGDKPVSGHVPFTPKAKKLMELALREALQLGHNYIGTEHLLLGVLRDATAVGVNELARGVEVNALRKTVLELLGQVYEERATAAPMEAVGPLLVERKTAPAKRSATYNAHLQDLVRELDQRAVDTDVLDFERTTTERPTDPAGEYVEVVTIRWRRRTP
jgi:ATP-dependent Clp protease ATP-binding subunit ClpC